MTAFAYAKFSDRRDKSKDDTDSDSGKGGSSAARRAAMEETIDDQEKKRRGRKIYENPTNKVLFTVRFKNVIDLSFDERVSLR